MADDPNKVVVPVAMQGVDEAVKLVDKLGKELIATKTDASGVAKVFNQYGAELSQALKMLTKFQKTLSQVQSGDLQARINKIDPNIQATLKAEKDALKEKERAQKASIDQRIAAERLQYAEAVRQNKLAIAQQAADDKLRIAQKKKDTIAAFRELAAEEKRISRQTQAELSRQSPQAAAQKAREAAVLRVTGDGGASLFKIQSALLVNYTVMNQLFNLVQFGTTYVMELETAFADLQAITASTNTEMKGLEDTIIAVSKGTKYSAVEVAEAAKVLAQAGFSAQEIKESIQGVVLLATATGTDLATSVDVASSAISVFELRAGDMDRVANVLTGALNETKLTMDKVALGLQYAGNIANQAGLSFEETTAILGAMSNAGIRSGSTLGTGLRQVIIELMNPSEKLRSKLSEVGLSIQDVDLKSKGFVGVMKNLRDAGFSTADAFETLEVRSAAAFAAIQNDPEIITRLQTSFLFTTAAAKANAVQMDTLAAKFAVLRNNLGLVINQFSTPFVSGLKVAADVTTVFLGVLQELGIVLPAIGTVLISFGAAAAGLKIATLVGNLGLLTKTFAGLNVAIAAARVGGIAGLATAIPLLITPLGALTVAITAVASAFYLLNSGASDLKDSIDQTTASLDQSEGAYATTAESMNSVEKEMTRLVDRMMELKDAPDEVFNQFLQLENQFGSLGFEIENTTNPSVDNLIDGLNRLRTSLRETSVEQMKFIQAQRSMLLLQQGKQIGNIGNSMWSRPLGNFSDTRLEDITGAASKALSTDTSTMTKQQRLDLMKELAAYRTALIKLNTETTETLKTMEKAGKEGTATYLFMKNRQAKITEAQAKIGEAAGGVIDLIADTSTQLKNTFKTTDLSKMVDAELQAYDKELSRLRENAADTPEGKVKLQQDIKALGKKLDEAIGQLLSNRLGIALDFLRQAGFEVGPNDVTAIVGDIETQTKQAIEEGASDVNRLNDETKAAVDLAMQKAELGLQTIQKAYARVTDALDSKIKALDAIAKESQDLERGGLAGKYSDAEISMFQDRQKELQTKQLKARLDTLPGVIAALNGVIGAQSTESARIGSLPKSPANESLSIASQQKLNDLMDQRAGLQKELVDLQNEYNAAIGIETEAHVALGDQITYVIGKYSEQAAIQSTWAYGIKENVIGVLDNAKSAFGTFVTDVVSGTATVGDAFKSMATSILQSMLKIVSDKLAGQILGGILGSAGSLFGAMGSGSITSSGASLPSLNPNLNIPVGMNTGGYVRRAGGGGNRDSVKALLRPGEYVLRNQAVEMLGRDNLDQINAMGARSVSDAGSLPNASAGQAPSESSIVNVWIVPPNEKPQMGPKDIVAVITDDMARGGQTKKLVKQIVMGQS